MWIIIGEHEVRIGAGAVTPVHAVRLVDHEVLPAGMAKIFRCDAGKWPAGREAIFEPMASYGDGITVNPSLLAPKEGEVHLLIEKRSHVALI